MKIARNFGSQVASWGIFTAAVSAARVIRAIHQLDRKRAAGLWVIGGMPRPNPCENRPPPSGLGSKLGVTRPMALYRPEVGQTIRHQGADHDDRAHRVGHTVSFADRLEAVNFEAIAMPLERQPATGLVPGAHPESSGSFCLA